MWLSKKLHTYLLCVGAKSKMKANNGTSCYHPACILKQHGHVGQCQDSFPSQDLAVTKYRVKKQTLLTTQVLVAQYHVVIWIHGFPLCRPATLKRRKISSDWWQQSQSWLSGKLQPQQRPATSPQISYFFDFFLKKYSKVCVFLEGYSGGHQGIKLNNVFIVFSSVVLWMFMCGLG